VKNENIIQKKAEKSFCNESNRSQGVASIAGKNRDFRLDF